MSFSFCKKACTECPFLKTSLPGWLSSYTTEELHRLVMSENPFPCHMTHDEEISFSEAGTEKYPLCFGAMAFMKKNFKMPKDYEMSVFVKEIKIDETQNILSVPEFYKHHNKE